MITVPQNVYDVLIGAALGYTISGTVDVDTINYEFGLADGTHDRDYLFFWNGDHSIENITIKDGKLSHTTLVDYTYQPVNRCMVEDNVIKKLDLYCLARILTADNLRKLLSLNNDIEGDDFIIYIGQDDDRGYILDCYIYRLNGVFNVVEADEDGIYRLPKAVEQIKDKEFGSLEDVDLDYDIKTMTY